MDIHHDVSTNVYQKNLWEQPNPGKKLSNMDEAAEFADGMDQMVTSAKHHEAYDIGELTVEEFFEGGLGNVSVTGRQQLDNFTDTMKKKSTDWFEKTTGDAVKNTTEGMRQATKQYDKAISLSTHSWRKGLANPRILCWPRGDFTFQEMEASLGKTVASGGSSIKTHDAN